MTAHAVLHFVRGQRRFADKKIAAVGKLCDVVVWSGVGRIRDYRPVALIPQRERGNIVPGRRKRDRRVTYLDFLRRIVRLDFGNFEEIAGAFVGKRRRKLAKLFLAARRQPRWHAGCALARTVEQRVTEWDHVEEVIRGHMRDDDAVDNVILEMLAHVCERAGAEVENDAVLPVKEQVRATRPRRTRDRRAGAEDREGNVADARDDVTSSTERRTPV